MGKACPAHTSADFSYILYRHIFPKSLVRNIIFTLKLDPRQNHFGWGRAYLSCENDCACEPTAIRSRSKDAGHPSRRFVAVQFSGGRLRELSNTRFQNNRRVVVRDSDLHYSSRSGLGQIRKHVEISRVIVTPRTRS